MSLSACLLRIHDGSAKANWGGRATSAALLDLFANDKNFGRIVPISGTYILKGFEKRVSSDDEVLGEWPSDLMPPNPAPGKSHAFELSPIKRARQLIKNKHRLPIVNWLVTQFLHSDIVLMNGEGDFILTDRLTYWRTLVLLSISIELGRPTHLINVMISPDGLNHQDHKATIYGVQVLEKCSSVITRDKESLRILASLVQGVDTNCLPDALFSWYSAPSLPSLAVRGSMLEGLTSFVREKIKTPYVLLSGSSAVTYLSDYSQAKLDLKEFISQLIEKDLNPIIVATCNRDLWMSEVAFELNIPYVPPFVPLTTAQHLFKNALLFVSGRYHPSILAAVEVVPSIFMTSNSHKTRSLAELLNMQPQVEFNFYGFDFDSQRVLEHVAFMIENLDSIKSKLKYQVDVLSRLSSSLPELLSGRCQK